MSGLVGGPLASDPYVDELIDFTEEVGARSPGWFRARCGQCESTTTGSEPSVEDWAYEHSRSHLPKWRVYKEQAGFWGGAWIVQPPGSTFEDGYSFTSFRQAWQYVGDPAWRTRIIHKHASRTD